jgi:hypothetical protein
VRNQDYRVPAPTTTPDVSRVRADQLPSSGDLGRDLALRPVEDARRYAVTYLPGIGPRVTRKLTIERIVDV